MKISEITLPVQVETHTDAVRLIKNVVQLNTYIADYGNLECYYDAHLGRIRVPSLAPQQHRNTLAKLRDCNRFGSE